MARNVLLRYPSAQPLINSTGHDIRWYPSPRGPNRTEPRRQVASGRGWRSHSSSHGSCWSMRRCHSASQSPPNPAPAHTAGVGGNAFIAIM